jgi:hypothetical protein
VKKKPTPQQRAFKAAARNLRNALYELGYNQPENALERLEKARAEFKRVLPLRLHHVYGLAG